jgi:hypothetical protein
MFKKRKEKKKLFIINKMDCYDYSYLVVHILHIMFILLTGGDGKPKSHILKHYSFFLQHVFQFLILPSKWYTSYIWVIWYVVIGGVFFTGGYVAHHKGHQISDGSTIHAKEPLLNIIQIGIVMWLYIHLTNHDSAALLFAFYNIWPIVVNIVIISNGVGYLIDGDMLNLFKMSYSTKKALIFTPTTSFIIISSLVLESTLWLTITFILSIVMFLIFYFYSFPDEKEMVPELKHFMHETKNYIRKIEN